jgi:uncharacterized protein YkwD
MKKRRSAGWKRMGLGIAVSALTLTIGAFSVIAVSAPGRQPAESGLLPYVPLQQELKLSRFAAHLDADTTTAPPTLAPTPAATPAPTALDTAAAPLTPAPPIVTAPPAQPAAVIPPPPQPTPAPTPAPPSGYREDMAQALYGLLNDQRAANGVAPVSPNGILIASAEYYTKLHFTTADPYKLNHYLDGGPGDRAWARGYCCAVGEILVTSEGSVEGMVDLWMSSPPHHAVIVDPQYHEVGISCYGGTYVNSDGQTSHPVICDADFGAGG